MTVQIGLLGAFLGGVLTLISPCSALLLPSFFAYAFDRVATLLLRTTVFYLGLAVVLVPLGAGIGAVGSMLTRYREQATLIGGMVLIVLGMLMVLGKGFGVAAAQHRLSRLRLTSWGSVLVLGMVYGLAGFCAGPLLGSVLTVSAAGGSPVYGGVLLAVYAFGMAAPLFVLALLWDRLHLSRRRWLRGRPIRIGPLHTHSTSLISGILFIAIGMLFLLTDGTANLGGLTGVDTQFQLQVWLQEMTGNVPNAAVLLAPVLLALLIVLGGRYRRRRTFAPVDRFPEENDGPAHDQAAPEPRSPERPSP